MGSVLNGLGKQNRSAVHFLIGGAIQILCTYYLIAQPDIGINGFIIGFFLNTVTVSFLNFITAIRVTKLRIEWMEWFIKPGLAALLMGLSVRLMYLILIDLEVSYVISFMSSITVGLLIFITVLFLLGILPYSMIRMMKNKLRKLLAERKAL
jgi:stage V sporulation protein B